MPLAFTGHTVDNLTGISIQATNSATGSPVVVKASHEAIQDYGLPQVQEVASDKYDNGNVESDGSIFVFQLRQGMTKAGRPRRTMFRA